MINWRSVTVSIKLL